jgi:SSS family transporter
MAWLKANAFVLSLFALYTVLLAYHAMEGRRRTRSVADYYVGGRAMGGVALGLSFFATYSSTNSFVGFSGQAYSYGAPWLLLMPVAVVFSIMAWVVVAPRLRRFTKSLDSVTIPDFVGFRFGSDSARVLAALIVLCASFLYMTAVFKGIGNLLEVFLDIPYVAAILVVFVVVMLYTAVGGFVSVVRTDVVQGVVMIAAAVLLLMGTVTAAGGAESIDLVRDRPATRHLFRWDAAMPFPVLIGIVVAGTMKFVVEPRQLSRFYALEDERATRRGMWVSTLAFLFVYSLLLPVGLYARNIMPTGIDDTDLVVPTLVGSSGVFHPAAAAFLLVAMVAAAMSSLDSVLLVMASTCERDLVGMWRRRRSTEQSVLRETRWYVALFALITALIALNPPGQIVTLTAFSGSLYAACFFPTIVLGLHWRQGGGAAVTSSFVVGIAVLLGWKYLPAGATVHSVFPALLLSTLVYVLVAALTPRNAAAQHLFAGTGASAP